MSKPLNALEGLGKAISDSLLRLPSRAVEIIRKETDQSAVTVRNLDLLRDIQLFVEQIKGDFCDIFKSVDGNVRDSIDNFSVLYKLEELGTTELFGIRNTVLTNQSVTADPKLRPDYFNEKGRTRQIGRYLEKNWPFSARKFAKGFIVEQIHELLGIWAENTCELEFEIEKVLQWHDPYHPNVENFTRKCDVNIFGRGVASYFYLKIESEQETAIREVQAEEEAYDTALEEGEKAILVYQESDMWVWLHGERETIELEGPDETDEFEDSIVNWNWKIEATCDGGYCYVETDVDGWDRC